MNIIVTASRTGSTVFAHSLNASRGLPYDIDVSKKETPDYHIIGEHLHPVSGVTAERLRANESSVAATKISVVPGFTGWLPATEQFRLLLESIGPGDRVILYRRNLDDWAESWAKRILVGTFHVHSEEEMLDYRERLDAARVSPDREKTLDRARRLVEMQEGVALQALAESGATVMTVYYAEFLDRPEQTIRQALVFFDLYREGMRCRLETTCRKLPPLTAGQTGEP